MSIVPIFHDWISFFTNVKCKEEIFDQCCTRKYFFIECAQHATNDTLMFFSSSDHWYKILNNT